MLGMNDDTKGFAIMESMNSLRRKHERVKGTYDYEKDVRLRKSCSPNGAVSLDPAFLRADSSSTT